MTLFGTAGIRGPVATDVTPALALSVGQAAGSPGESFVVGYDGRQSGPALTAALTAGLASSGSSVVRVGMVPTPALAYASRGRRGVMVTASHNPPADNGLKLFDDGVEYDSDAEEAVATSVDPRIGADGQANEADAVTTHTDASNAVAWHEWGEIGSESVLDAYRDAVVSFVRDGDAVPTDHSPEPLAGLRIAVDCGTGVGGLATPHVLDRLGADVTAVNANVDGHFPARPSKPTPETLASFSSVVADSDVDCGLAQDGDADRLVVLGPDGAVVHEDTVLAAVAASYTARATADDPVVVTTPNASGRIDEQVTAAGGRIERVRLGALHEGIARVRETSGTVVFAAEPWKHIHPAFGGWIDGVLSAAVVATLVAEAGSVDALREPITERPYRKVSVDCPDHAKPAVMDRLESRLPDGFPDASVETDYGVRLAFPDASWILVRPSGTEPYVRVYAESEDVDDLVADVTETVEQAIADGSCQ